MLNIDSTEIQSENHDIKPDMDDLIDQHARSMGGDPSNSVEFEYFREIAAYDITHRMGFYLSLFIDKPEPV